MTEPRCKKLKEKNENSIISVCLAVVIFCLLFLMAYNAYDNYFSIKIEEVRYSSIDIGKIHNENNHIFYKVKYRKGKSYNLTIYFEDDLLVLGDNHTKSPFKRVISPMGHGVFGTQIYALPNVFYGQKTTRLTVCIDNGLTKKCDRSDFILIKDNVKEKR